MAKRVRRSRRGSVSRYTYRSAGDKVARWRWQLWVPSDPENPDSELVRVGGSGYETAEAAEDALSEALRKRADAERFARGVPTLGQYLVLWLDGLRLEASTVVGYRRIARNHIAPRVAVLHTRDQVPDGARAMLGDIRLDKLTASRIARHYRQLERSGRADAGHRGEPLSANSVNKVHMVLGAALDAAVDDGYISSNPARKTRTVDAPRGRQIRAARPEITTWSATELSAFLAWNRDVFDDELYPLWLTIAATGMRRSEALALRFDDVDFDQYRIRVRRAVDTSRAGQVKTTKTGAARQLDIDANLLEALREARSLRGQVSLDLARTDAYVFATLNGRVRSPNEVSRRWRHRVQRAQAELETELATITLKELRHTHATLLLSNGEHPKVVQERLGHSTIATTMNIYSHVTPTMQRDAADRFSMLVDGTNDTLAQK